jgi:hypothetical protein
MMRIIHHGTWSPYRPDALPALFPASALFCRRDDGTDWYEFLKQNVLLPDTVKLAVEGGAVKVATRDATAIWPINRLVLEVMDDDDESDPQPRYQGMCYDTEANGLLLPSEPPTLPPVKSPHERLDELEKRVKALEARKK